MMSSNKPIKTPSRVLRLADFDFLRGDQPKQSLSQRMQPRRSMIPPTSQAKRIVDLYAEIMPPPGTNNTTASKRKTLSQKTYMSTSKKQLHNRKTDHAVVRRALNFIGNQVEDVNLHPKSKPITRKSIATFKFSSKENRQLGVFSQVKNFDTKQADVTNQKSNSPKIKNSLQEECNIKLRYDLRSHKNSPTNDSRTMYNYTDYREINQSFDASICDENSPKVGPLEKSLCSYQTPPKQSDVSNLLCDLLQKTEITPPNIYQQIRTIELKIQENNKEINDRIESFDNISKQIREERNKLELCLENNKETLKLTSELINSLQKENKDHFKKISNKTATINKHNTVMESKITVNTKSENKNMNLSFSKIEIKKEPADNKENVKTPSKSKQKVKISDYDLRRTVLLTTLENKESVAISTKPASILKDRNNFQTSKTLNNRLMFKQVSPEAKPSPCGFKTHSPKASKSSQIYKSLKDSIKFLKTPVGKRSVMTHMAVETPNTRSRNITSNNIKKQLESLYDS